MAVAPGARPLSPREAAAPDAVSPRSSAPLADDQDATLTGQVLDAEGQPLGGARVLAVCEDDGISQLRQADPQGRFAIALAPGRWTLTAAASGYSPASATTTIPRAEALELRLGRAGSIAGRVFDPEGHPTVAEVVLVGSGIWPARRAEADADGRFAFQDVPEGVYEVSAQTERGAAPARRGLSIDAGHRAFLTFHVERGELLAGAVLDAATGEPIEGAAIRIAEGELGAAPRALLSAADGSFRLPGVRPVTHHVSVEAPGFVGATALPWTPGERLRVALERGAVLAGVVLDERRRPVEGARLSLAGETAGGRPLELDSAIQSFQTTLFDAHSGAAVAPEGVAAALGPLPITTDVPALPLEGAGAEPATLAPGERSPIVASAVSPTPSRGVLTTGADGRFRIEGVPPGQVQIVARHTGHAPATASLYVAAGSERDDLEVQLLRAGRIEGRVVDDGGEPVASVLVEARGEHDTFPRVAMTRDDGTFAFGDLAGAIVVRAQPGGRAGTTERVEVPPGATRQLELTLPAAGLAMAGSVSDARGRAIEGAQVRIESLVDGRTVVARSDARGHYDVSGAGAGPWRVHADHPRYAMTAGIDLAPDYANAPIAITLDEAIEVRGRVFDAASGEPIEGASITLEPDVVPPLTRSVASDAEGNFIVARADVGRAWVRIEAPGHVAFEGEVELRARFGEATIDDVELEEAATLEGEVVDALGRVVRGALIRVDGLEGVEASSDPRGHFVLAGLPAGTLTLLASHPAAGLVESPLQVRRGLAPAAAVLRLPRRFDPESAVQEDGEGPGVRVVLARDSAGVVVSYVARASAAHEAGVRAGDVVIAIDGREPAGLDAAQRLLRGPAGSHAILELSRRGAPFFARTRRER